MCIHTVINRIWSGSQDHLDVLDLLTRAELVCNKTEHLAPQLNSTKKKKMLMAPETVYEAECEIKHVMEHFF